MLKAVGAKTWAALADGATAVGLECINDITAIIPSANYAANGGTPAPLPSSEIRTSG